MVKGRDVIFFFFQIVNQVCSTLYWILHPVLNDWVRICHPSLPNTLPPPSPSNSVTPCRTHLGNNSSPDCSVWFWRNCTAETAGVLDRTGMGDPVSAASHGHGPGTGTWPQQHTRRPSLRFYILTAKKVIFFLDLCCKNRSLELSTTTPPFPLSCRKEAHQQ